MRKNMRNAGAMPNDTTSVEQVKDRRAEDEIDGVPVMLASGGVKVKAVAG
jgi:hypothetical protein